MKFEVALEAMRNGYTVKIKEEYAKGKYVDIYYRIDKDDWGKDEILKTVGYTTTNDVGIEAHLIFSDKWEIEQ